MSIHNSCIVMKESCLLFLSLLSYKTLRHLLWAEFQERILKLFNSERPVCSPKTSSRLQGMLILLVWINARGLAGICLKVQSSQQQTLVYQDSCQCTQRISFPSCNSLNFPVKCLFQYISNKS